MRNYVQKLIRGLFNQELKENYYYIQHLYKCM